MQPQYICPHFRLFQFNIEGAQKKLDKTIRFKSTNDIMVVAIQKTLYYNESISLNIPNFTLVR